MPDLAVVAKRALDIQAAVETVPERTECGIDIDVGGVIAQRFRRRSGIGGIALPDVTLSKVGLRRHAVTTLDVHIIKAALPMQRLVGVSNQADLGARSEEHTSELQSLMRISYAVFCLK